MYRILVIQLKRAGDVIVTTPILPALRKALPDARIDFLVDKAFAPLLENNPYIDQIQAFDRRAIWHTWRKLRVASYDWIVDFQSSPRSILAGLYSGARVRIGYRVPFWGMFFSRAVPRPGVGLTATDGKMTLIRHLLPELGQADERQIYLTEAERDWAANQMAGAKPEKGIIGMISTHRRSSRRWSAASFAELARRFMAQGNSVWMFWGPGEKEYVEAITRQAPGSQMIPDATLRQMAALLERCKTVITNDNGPMHLAAAVGTPTVTVYGPTDPVAWNPGGPRHRVVQAPGLSCLGCNLNDCPFEHECMNWVTPERMMTEFRSLAAIPAGISS